MSAAAFMRDLSMQTARSCQVSLQILERERYAGEAYETLRHAMRDCVCEARAWNHQHVREKRSRLRPEQTLTHGIILR